MSIIDIFVDVKCRGGRGGRGSSITFGFACIRHFELVIRGE